MNSTDAELWDWMRILLGGVPWVFLIEVVIRVTFIYLLLVAALRIMGKRMSALISRNEMIAMVSLAAAVGLPMQDPEQGLLPVVIVAAVVIGVQRIISTRTVKNPGFESMITGGITSLTSDGRLQLSNMEDSRITRERILTEIRAREVNNLGKVQRAYLESNGAFTIYLYDEDEERDGLCILPDWDKDYLEELTVADGAFACGNVKTNQKEPEQECEHCGHIQWHKAIRS